MIISHPKPVFLYLLPPAHFDGLLRGLIGLPLFRQKRMTENDSLWWWTDSIIHYMSSVDAFIGILFVFILEMSLLFMSRC